MVSFTEGVYVVIHPEHIENKKFKYGYTTDMDNAGVGIVMEVQTGRYSRTTDIIVKFPNIDRIYTFIPEELLPAVEAQKEQFNVGDSVYIAPHVLAYKRAAYNYVPLMEEAGVGVVRSVYETRDSYDLIRVYFPAINQAYSFVSPELVAAPVFKVGDKVRVRSDVQTPKYGWGAVTCGDVGVITRISGDHARVYYPKHKSWNAHLPEMEKVEDASHHFQNGDIVRFVEDVRRGKREPKVGGWDPTEATLGVVTEDFFAEDKICVAFLEDPAAHLIVHVDDLEVVPNLDFLMKK